MGEHEGMVVPDHRTIKVAQLQARCRPISLPTGTRNESVGAFRTHRLTPRLRMPQSTSLSTRRI